MVCLGAKAPSWIGGSRLSLEWLPDLADSTLTGRARRAGLGAAATELPYRFTPAMAALTCAAAPTYVLRWHVGFYPTDLLEVLIGATIVVFVLETLRTGSAIVWRTPFTYPAALLLVAGLIAVAVSPDHRAGLGLYRAYLVEPILFFFVLTTVVRRADTAHLVVGGLALGGLVAGLANSAVVLRAERAHTLNLAIAPPVVIYNTPNAVALYLVPLVAVAAAVALHAGRPRLRLAAVGFVALAGLAVLLSFSRGGYAALAVVAVGLALSHPRRWWLLGGLAAAALVLTRLPLVATRLAHELNATDPNNSLVSRFKLWQATLRMLRDHPVTGSGLSGFARSIGPYRGGIYQEDLIYPHNVLLNFWTETGLLGLAAFAWLLVQAVRTGVRGWRRCAAEWRPLQLGVVLAMVAILVHGMVDVPYWKNDLSLEFWVLLGVAAAGVLHGLAAGQGAEQPNRAVP